MQNPKTAIQEIKKLMVQFGFMSNEPTLASFKLKDNTIVETPELKVGNKITKLNEQFQRVVLQDGKFRLVENFEIKVKDGTIKSVKQIFMEEKLVDGTEIMIEGDELEEGARVKVITEEMSEEGIVAPDGVHELEDGTKIETKEGVIVKIEEVVSEEMEEVEVPVEVPAEVAPVAQEVVEAIVEAIVPLMEEVKILVDEMKKMKDGMKQMNAEFEAFKKQPAGKKISDGKTDFNKQSNSDDVIADRLAAIAAMRKK
jgi:hypothetical protein